MSPKAAFYILAEPSLKARDLYACRVIEKAYTNGHTIYVHTATMDEAQNFDTQLWTFRDISFVPHEIYSQNSTSGAPILIGYNGIAPEKKEILINLTSEIPSFYQQFDHIIEIIPNDDQLKTAARKQYQVYQHSGYQMETFNIPIGLIANNKL
ncbi:MAG: DNA polymerase III, chi subunit superfamily [uncultured bacterium]|nr:MAG: DNA polymerase III, chi subunit superfamily [uncultured bacterium]